MISMPICKVQSCIPNKVNPQPDFNAKLHMASETQVAQPKPQKPRLAEDAYSIINTSPPRQAGRSCHTDNFSNYHQTVNSFTDKKKSGYRYPKHPCNSNHHFQTSHLKPPPPELTWVAVCASCSWAFCNFSSKEVFSLSSLCNCSCSTLSWDCICNDNSRLRTVQ